MPVDMVASFPRGKPPVPRKFRIERSDGQFSSISVDRILSVEKRKTAGVEAYVYQCQSLLDGIEKPYELKYAVSLCSWELYKL